MKLFEKNEGDDKRPIESKMLTSAITSAQKRIEGQNFDIRKNLLDYDDVLSKQRQIMYSKRDQILYADDIHELLLDTFNDCGKALAKRAINENSDEKLVSGEKLSKIMSPQFLPEGSIKPSYYDETLPDEISDDISEILLDAYTQRKKQWDPDLAEKVERNITLRIIDKNWTQQIDNMNRFRESVSLRSYAQTNPLQDYVNEGWDMFREMLETISLEVVLNLLNIKVAPKQEEKKEAFTVEAKEDVTGEILEKQVEKKETSEEVVNDPNLNISHIDKDKTAAPEYKHEDIHTN